MAKISIFSAISNRILREVTQNKVLLSIKQSRIVVASVSIGITLVILFREIFDSVSSSELIQKLIGKSVSETAYPQESITKTLGAIKQDEYIAADSVFLNPRKQIIDDASITDAQIKSISKQLTNFAISLDSISLETSYARTFFDSVNAGDAISVEIILPIELFDLALASDDLSLIASYFKQYENAVLALDESALSPIASQVENGTASDVFQRQVDFIRFFNSSAAVTDDVGGEATADDDQTIQFFKQITNLAQASENAVRFAGKVVSDILGAADSGVLLNQDYVDNPYYFAEDYVGVKRTF